MSANRQQRHQTVTELPSNSGAALGLMKEGVTLARFAGFDLEERFLVFLPNVEGAVSALSTIALTKEEVGVRVVIAFEAGDSTPVILGRVQGHATPAAPVEQNVKLDGERLVFNAEKEIELRCGDASIVLTKAGKVLIQGNFVLSRSRGANKIKGAFIDIN